MHTTEGRDSLKPLEKNYYDLIVAGERTLEQAPRQIREAIKKALIKDGYMTDEEAAK